MIDPVHMQGTVARAPEVARVQRVQEGAPEAQSQVFAQELARERQEVERTVPSSPQSARTEWKREREKREGRKAKAGGRGLEGQKDQKVPAEPGHLIDTTA